MLTKVFQERSESLQKASWGRGIERQLGIHNSNVCDEEESRRRAAYWMRILRELFDSPVKS